MEFYHELEPQGHGIGKEIVVTQERNDSERWQSAEHELTRVYAAQEDKTFAWSMPMRRVYSVRNSLGMLS